MSISPNNSKSRTVFVLTVMAISMIALIVDSIQGKGWVSAARWGYGFSVVFLAYALFTRDKILLHFFAFCIVAGFAELVADAWLVDYTRTLIYPMPEPMLWRSPTYMPFSWTVVLMEIGYIGWLLSYRWNLIKASIALCFLGAMLVPLYELWAIHAKWWHYENTPLIKGVPIYVIIAEGLLMISLPFMLRKVENAKPLQTFLWGLAEGVVMLLACIIAYAIIG